MTSSVGPAPGRAATIGEVIEVAGRKQWISVAGSGSPVVILESAVGDVGLTWGLVHPLIASNTATFTYDRAGLGRSDRGGATRDADSIVEELRATLAAARLEPPYVLVGHSFASLLVRAFAGLHEDEVVGLVLVDGAHEDQMERFPPELNSAGMLSAFATQLRELAAAMRRGESVPELSPVPEVFPPELATEYLRAMTPTDQRLATTAEEYEALPGIQDRVRDLARAARSDLPLIALRHGVAQPMPGVPDEVNERYEAAWIEMQEDLASRSSNGEVRVATGAGHLIHHERPELVAAAIGDVIRRSRERG